MPLYMALCTDKPGALDIRKANREAHLAYVAETGCVVLAGPLLDEAGEMAGSLIILDLPDIEAAKAWGAADPYAQAGLFESVRLQEWKRVVG